MTARRGCPNGAGKLKVKDGKPVADLTGKHIIIPPPAPAPRLARPEAGRQADLDL